jgi:hypothetical protein
VDDVQPGAVVELRVLEAFRSVELAVRGGRVVEDLCQRAHNVLVVVKRLVVIAARPPVPFDEYLVGCVDHHLPDIVVLEQ